MKFGSIVLAKREQALASREARLREKHRIAAITHEAGTKLARMGEKLKKSTALAAETTAIDAVIEFSGTLAEATAKIKAPTLQKYAGVGGLGIELVSMIMLADTAAGTSKSRLLKGTASFGRGLRARAAVGLADDMAAKIFG